MARAPSKKQPTAGQGDSAGPIWMRIRRELAGLVRAEAQSLGLSEARWVNALVSRRVLRQPVLSRQEELAIISIQMELRRIGVQARHVLTRAEDRLGDGAAITAQGQQLAELHREIRHHLRDLRAALQGNLDYWESDL